MVPDVGYVRFFARSALWSVALQTPLAATWILAAPDPCGTRVFSGVGKRKAVKKPYLRNPLCHPGFRHAPECRQHDITAAHAGYRAVGIFTIKTSVERTRVADASRGFRPQSREPDTGPVAHRYPGLTGDSGSMKAAAEIAGDLYTVISDFTSQETVCDRASMSARACSRIRSGARSGNSRVLGVMRGDNRC